MKTVYSLRNDSGLAGMQTASQACGEIGLKQTHGLVGSDEWWRHVEEGLLPTSTTAGTVIHFFRGHHGDWPEIEVREPDGTSSNWGCLIPAVEAEKHFALGAKVEFDHVPQELKVPFNGANATRLVIAIRVGPTIRSSRTGRIRRSLRFNSRAGSRSPSRSAVLERYFHAAALKHGIRKIESIES